MTESREEDLYDRQKKMIFGRKFQTLLDRSEQQPNSQNEGKRNSMVAIDCLTIEEEQPEDAAVAEVELLSNDGESGRFSTPRSRSLQHLRVDEMSADEEKKRKKFEQQIEEVIEERPTEEEDMMPEAHKRNRHVRDNLVKIVMSEMVCPQDSEILKIIDPKESSGQPMVEEEISEEGLEDPADNCTDTG